MASFVTLHEKLLLLIQTKCSFVATSPSVPKSMVLQRIVLQAGSCLAPLAMLPCWGYIWPSGLISFGLSVPDLVLVTWIYVLISLCDVHHPSAKHLTDCCAYTAKWLRDYNMIRHVYSIFNLAATGNSKNAAGTDPLWTSSCTTLPGPQRASTVHAQVRAATFSQLPLLLCYHAIIWLGGCSIQK